MALKKESDRPRCGKWMPVSRGYCARPAGHSTATRCLTEDALRRLYDRSIVYHTERRDKRRRAIDAYKLERGCIDCGYRGSAVALDLDHTDPSAKVKGVSEMVNHSWKSVLAELSKCDVRCANCHRVKTHRKNHEDPQPVD
jgi:hypothetical protein